MRYTTFGVGGLLFAAFERLYPILQNDDWEEKLKVESIENQYLRIKTESGRKRIVTEIIKRCRSAWPAFWDFYAQQNEIGRKAALFALCIKAYPIVSDLHHQLATRVFWLKDEIKSYELVLNEIEKMANASTELENWADSTKIKTAQTYLRALFEAGLMEKNLLTKIQLPETWFCFFMRNGDHWVLDAFFTTESEKQHLKNFCQ